MGKSSAGDMRVTPFAVQEMIKRYGNGTILGLKKSWSNNHTRSQLLKIIAFLSAAVNPGAAPDQNRYNKRSAGALCQRQTSNPQRIL
jgi:hypothetical protein